MMLRFFRSYNKMVIMAIVVIGIASWLHVAGKSEIAAEDRYGTFMYHALSGWLAPKLHSWAGLVLFMVTALMMIQVNNRLQLLDRISCLPALCFVLLAGLRRRKSPRKPGRTFGGRR